MNGFETILNELSGGARRYFGAAQAEIELQHRVDGPYSSVLRVGIRTERETRRAYVKILKPRGSGAEELARVTRFLDREYRATRSLHDRLEQDREIGAVRPLACLPEYHALVTEEVPGRPLGAILQESRAVTPELTAIASRIGRWVRVYQGQADGAAPVDFSERREYFDERLRALDGRILAAGQRNALLAAFDGLAFRLGAAPVPAVPIHADLTPMNVIVGEDGRVTVLDFTMAKTGTPHHDLAHLYFHLALTASRRRRRAPVYAAVQQAMLRGYDPGLTPDAPLFRLMLWQHAICHVAMLAERSVGPLDPVYRWFVRRRWGVCARLPVLAFQE